MFFCGVRSSIGYKSLNLIRPSNQSGPIRQTKSVFNFLLILKPRRIRLAPPNPSGVFTQNGPNLKLISFSRSVISDVFSTGEEDEVYPEATVDGDSDEKVKETNSDESANPPGPLADLQEGDNKEDGEVPIADKFVPERTIVGQYLKQKYGEDYQLASGTEILSNFDILQGTRKALAVRVIDSLGKMSDLMLN